MTKMRATNESYALKMNIIVILLMIKDKYLKDTSFPFHFFVTIMVGQVLVFWR